MIDAQTRKLVWQRADDCCEYCRLRQEHLPYVTFHIEHVISKKHGGGDGLWNLALACDRCNLHKGSNLAGLDPMTGRMTSLFNPRTQDWAAHFRLDGLRILGRTATGRATVQVLQFNSPRRLRLRARLMATGEM